MSDFWWLLIAAAFIILGLLYVDALHELAAARKRAEALRQENFTLQEQVTAMQRLRTALHQSVPRRVPGQRRRTV